MATRKMRADRLKALAIATGFVGAGIATLPVVTGLARSAGYFFGTH